MSLLTDLAEDLLRKQAIKLAKKVVQKGGGSVLRLIIPEVLILLATCWPVWGHGPP